MPKFDLDAALVRKLSRLLEETGLTEIEYESAGRRIRVVRSAAGAPRPSASCSAIAASALSHTGETQG